LHCSFHFLYYSLLRLCGVVCFLCDNYMSLFVHFLCCGQAFYQVLEFDDACNIFLPPLFFIFAFIVFATHAHCLCCARFCLVPSLYLPHSMFLSCSKISTMLKLSFCHHVSSLHSLFLQIPHVSLFFLLICIVCNPKNVVANTFSTCVLS